MISLLRWTPTSSWVLVLCDFAIVILFYFMGLGVVLQPEWSQLLYYMAQGLFLAGTVTVCMFMFGLYGRDCMFGGLFMFLRASASFTIAILLLSLVFYAVPDFVIWRRVLILSLPFGFCTILAYRFVCKSLLDAHRIKRCIAVIGTGHQAARIEALDHQKYATFYIAGYLSAGPEPCEIPSERVVTPAGSLLDFLRDQKVEEIVIATSKRDALDDRALVDCRLGGIRIIDYQVFFGRETGRVDLDFLRPEWFLVDEGFHAARQRTCKRAVDIILSAFLLAFWAPLFAIIAGAIWCEDRGSVLYAQQRVGRAGKEFTLTKFRSMRRDAESDGVPRWSTATDDRITKIGRILRATHLDELPQLWAVLKGDMSFVGPRPERGYFVRQLSKLHPYYLDRHAVKPGLTGWAQINFPYTCTDHDARTKLEYDLFYVRYGSLFLDIAILLQTVRYLMAMKTRKPAEVVEGKQDLPCLSGQQASFTLQANDIVRESWPAVSDPATH